MDNLHGIRYKCNQCRQSCPNGRRNAETPKFPALLPKCMHCLLNWPKNVYRPGQSQTGQTIFRSVCDVLLSESVILEIPRKEFVLEKFFTLCVSSCIARFLCSAGTDETDPRSPSEQRGSGGKINTDRAARLYKGHRSSGPRVQGSSLLLQLCCHYRLEFTTGGAAAARRPSPDFNQFARL